MIAKFMDASLDALFAKGGGGGGGEDTHGASKVGSLEQLPVDVAAWLQLQQLRSEKIQFQMLQLQNLADLWRGPAFTSLGERMSVAMSHSSGGEQAAEQSQLREAIEAFVEEVGMDVPVAPPETSSVKDQFEKKAKAHEKHITSAVDVEEEEEVQREGNGVQDGGVAAVDAVESGGVAGAPAVAVTSPSTEEAPAPPLSAEQSAARARFYAVVSELVNAMEGLKADNAGELEQCMECEHQKEQQKELEQQTEMEKYVDCAYSRENEEPTPWLFEQLRNLYGPGDAKSRMFYPASMFRLNRRKPLLTPAREASVASHQDGYRTEDLFMSSNYCEYSHNGFWMSKARARPCYSLLTSMCSNLNSCSQPQVERRAAAAQCGDGARVGAALQGGARAQVASGAGLGSLHVYAQ